MTWLLIFAVLVVLLVGGAVLPRHADYRGESGAVGFPWFWIVFAMTALAVALAFSAWLPGSPASGFDFGWGMYAPLVQSDGSADRTFLSDEAAWKLLGGQWARIGYPLLGIVGVGLSTWAWKKGWI
ncbi:hypothetical protein [Corynebacterium sputi]|uniref:hypothetical protein n=1 Tax=Corynebacterium sputi TaxID=489915 RepID=UPI0003F57B82|nr:hypothetical protein [Corynebacterium sputi]